MGDIPDILKRIVEVKRCELDELEPKAAEFESRAMDAPSSEDFGAVLRRAGLSVIAEVKKASPSAGNIAGEGFDPAEVARSYEDGGAAAVSVLTDREFFQGAPEYLAEVAGAVSLPVLRKDFIISATQIFEARALGADSFLLIAAILERAELEDFLGLGRSLGMEALVESHDEDELEKAISAGADIIGVNARDLRTFEVDLATVERLARLIPKDAAKVAESGIKTPEDALRLAGAGYDAILVGETLSRLSPLERGAWIGKVKTGG
jgi:indole-3-glycerol phosphate synthase